MNSLSDQDETTSERAATPLMVQCSVCRSVGYPDDRYCACCGRPMPRQCGKCGADVLHRAANYCTRCGVPLRGGR